MRAFERSQRVTASLVIYQTERRTPEPVSLETRIQDAEGAVVARSTRTIDVDRFGSVQAAPVDYALPLADLAPGKYLLTIRASVDDHVVARDVPFTVVR